ncbi:MAG: class I SAM-dependent methyltransferase [Planctomycetota bacterium]
MTAPTDGHAPLPDRHDLYEACVQSPPEMYQLLRAIHGSSPMALAEDFAGTGDLARYWVDKDPSHAATVIDLDSEALARCAEHDRITAIVGDVREPRETVPADVLHAGNFSIGYMHTRAELVEYLRRAHSRLRPDGVFVCDTYGGESAFLIGSTEKDVPLPHGRHCRYTWEQREADPLTGMVTDVLHFRVFDADEAVLDLPDAFVYRWRLWSVPELRDAMAEAGFAETNVYSQLPDAVDDAGNAYAEPVTDPDWLGDSFIVCVAARRGR